MHTSKDADLLRLAQNIGYVYGGGVQVHRNGDPDQVTELLLQTRALGCPPYPAGFTSFLFVFSSPSLGLDVSLRADSPDSAQSPGDYRGLFSGDAAQYLAYDTSGKKEKKKKVSAFSSSLCHT